MTTQPTPAPQGDGRTDRDELRDFTAALFSDEPTPMERTLERFNAAATDHHNIPQR